MTTKLEQETSGDVGWELELLVRNGVTVGVIYFDGDTRGQVELRNREETNKWLKMLKDLNRQD